MAITVGLFFASSSAFGDTGYGWFARISGFFFLILQQIILLDLAYDWNKRCLKLAGFDEESNEDQKTTLGMYLILLLCASIYFFSYAALGENRPCLAIPVRL